MALFPRAAGVAYGPAMRLYGKWQRVLAIGLAFVAGFVDAIGFLKLGGLFVSFMSGNSTRLAVGTVLRDRAALTAATLILAFVIGVALGASVGRLAGDRRKVVVLAFVTSLLVLAASATVLRDPTVPTLLMAAAMGAANDVFQRDGEVSVGVTYMTGTLVKFAQHLAAVPFGGARTAWLPYLLLWIGLVAGAVAGAAAFAMLELRALWVAAGLAASLTAFAAAAGRLRRDRR